MVLTLAVCADYFCLLWNSMILGTNLESLDLCIFPQLCNISRFVYRMWRENSSWSVTDFPFSCVIAINLIVNTCEQLCGESITSPFDEFQCSIDCDMPHLWEVNITNSEAGSWVVLNCSIVMLQLRKSNIVTMKRISSMSSFFGIYNIIFIPHVVEI